MGSLVLYPDHLALNRPPERLWTGFAPTWEFMGDDNYALFPMWEGNQQPQIVGNTPRNISPSTIDSQLTPAGPTSNIFRIPQQTHSNQPSSMPQAGGTAWDFKNLSEADDDDKDTGYAWHLTNPNHIWADGSNTGMLIFGFNYPAVFATGARYLFQCGTNRGIDGVRVDASVFTPKHSVETVGGLFGPMGFNTDVFWQSFSAFHIVVIRIQCDGTANATQLWFDGSRLNTTTRSGTTWLQSNGDANRYEIGTFGSNHKQNASWFGTIFYMYFSQHVWSEEQIQRFSNDPFGHLRAPARRHGHRRLIGVADAASDAFARLAPKPDAFLCGNPTTAPALDGDTAFDTALDGATTAAPALDGAAAVAPTLDGAAAVAPALDGDTSFDAALGGGASAAPALDGDTGADAALDGGATAAPAPGGDAGSGTALDGASTTDPALDGDIKTSNCD